MNLCSQKLLLYFLFAASNNMITAASTPDDLLQKAQNAHQIGIFNAALAAIDSFQATDKEIPDIISHKDKYENI